MISFSTEKSLMFLRWLVELSEYHGLGSFAWSVGIKI